MSDETEEIPKEKPTPEIIPNSDPNWVPPTDPTPTTAPGPQTIPDPAPTSVPVPGQPPKPS